MPWEQQAAPADAAKEEPAPISNTPVENIDQSDVLKDWSTDLASMTWEMEPSEPDKSTNVSENNTAGKIPEWLANLNDQEPGTADTLPWDQIPVEPVSTASELSVDETPETEPASSQPDETPAWLAHFQETTPV